MIAGVTGAGGVRPLIFATARFGQDMIDGEITFGYELTFDCAARLYTAVNAGVVISHQHTLAAPMRLTAWDVDISTQGDDGWDGELVADRS
jgi:hypothetical protein